MPSNFQLDPSFGIIYWPLPDVVRSKFYLTEPQPSILRGCLRRGLQQAHLHLCTDEPFQEAWWSGSRRSGFGQRSGTVLLTWRQSKPKAVPTNRQETVEELKTMAQKMGARTLDRFEADQVTHVVLRDAGEHALFQAFGCVAGASTLAVSPMWIREVGGLAIFNSKCHGQGCWLEIAAFGFASPDDANVPAVSMAVREPTSLPEPSLWEMIQRRIQGHQLRTVLGSSIFADSQSSALAFASDPDLGKRNRDCL